MNDNLAIILQNYWFSEKEARVYITLLSLWELPASTISRHIWEKRTTTYAILKEMVRKWYVSEIEKKSTFQYSAVSPEILLWNIERKFLDFKEVLPQLTWIMNQVPLKMDIQYLYGDKWLESLFTDFANSEIDVKSFSWVWKYNGEVLWKKAKYYIKKRIEKWSIYKRIVSRYNLEWANDDDFFQKLKKKDLSRNRKTAIVDDLLDIQADIDIYWPGKISFLYFEKGVPNIIIINNQLIYGCLNAIFDIIWQQNYK